MPWNPVSVALYTTATDGPDSERLLVVSRGSYVLTSLDRLTGDVLDVLALPPEPGDILVDQDAHRAFVSCAAQDKVVEIDLLSQPTIVAEYRIPSRNPLFLSFDAMRADDDTTEPPPRDVLVAPLYSGNNSVVARDPNDPLDHLAHPPGILDLDDPNVALSGLPDLDLFRIRRATGVVEPVAKAMGTILFAQGVNPATGDLWQLNTEASNKDPNRQSEPAVKGHFVTNRLSIATLAAPGNPPVTPTTILDLDDSDLVTPGVQYDPTKTVGQPFALHFSSTGYGFVTGILTDNVTLLSPAGAPIFEFDVTAGSIPRGVVYSEVLQVAFVHCWGTNEVETWHFGTGAPWVTFHLGLDPSPAPHREGRQIFYDASHSENQNLSCASCHVDALTDMAVWNLGVPTDDKGPMFTQMLRGTSTLDPLHWRGERPDVEAFNGAFVGLLGAPSKLDDVQAEKFFNFLRDLQSPANPNQNRDRLLDNSIQPPLIPDANGNVPVADAIAGQTLFGSSCEGCHNVVKGTNNEIQNTSLGKEPWMPRRQRVKVAPFLELYRKEQDVDPATPGVQFATVQFNTVVNPQFPPTDTYAALGAGLAHAGLLRSLHDFLQIFQALQPQDRTNITGFVHQWDSGVAPASHEAFLLNNQTEPVVGPELAGHLKSQADQRHIDIAAYGWSRIAGQPVDLAWVYDPATQLLVADDSTVPPQSIQTFRTDALNGDAVYVFEGRPVGNAEGRRDPDLDGAWTRDELAAGSDPDDPDTDGDGWLDGHELANGGNPTDATIFPNDATPPAILDARTLWVTTEAGRINVVTDELTTVSVAVQTSQGGVLDFESDALGWHHSIPMTALLASTAGGPSFTYSGTITALDLGGNTTTVPVPASAFGPPPFTTRIMASQPSEVVIGRLDTTLVTRAIPTGGGPGTLTVSVDVRTDRKTGGPPAIQVGDHVVFGRVFVTPAGSTAPPQLYSNVSGVRSGSFQVAGQPYGTGGPQSLSGPFVWSTLTAVGTGTGTFDFSVNGLSAGDEVRLVIDGVSMPVDVTNHDPANPDMVDFSRWSMPDTPEPLLEEVVVF